MTVDGLVIEVVRKNVRNINLRVRRDGSVYVSAARHVSSGAIEDFVRAKRPWIESARARIARQERTCHLSFRPGEVLMLWGEPLVCDIAFEGTPTRRPTHRFEVRGDTLRLTTSPPRADEGDGTYERHTKALDRWLREQLRNEVERMLPRCQQLVGKACSAIRLREMSSRWGSCNVATAAITLNTHLVHHERRCLEYVLVHELCHLLEPSHNARFHALMDRFLPSWRETRALLNQR